MEKYTRTRIKELHEFSARKDPLTGKCSLTLYDVDKDGNETDAVAINLSRDKLASLIACLQAIQKPKAFRPRTFEPKAFP